MADRRDRRRSNRQRSGLVEIANGLLALFILGVLAVAALFFYGVNRFYADSSIAGPTIFVVERGSGLSTTAARLEEAGLIENRFIFMIGANVIMREGVRLQAGEFSIPARASMATILRELVEGRPVQYAVTIPEGFTSWQVVDRLNGEDLLTGEILALPPEGSVLPQTYNYDRGSRRDDVLARMQQDMKALLAQAWAECAPDVCGPDQPIRTPEQLVTLASIVEKETGIPAERPQVAAVFLNRLRKGMRLQSDPTIIYGITKGTEALGRDLRKSEIEAVNGYNTYTRDGLPVGPIANPGKDSLMAVANPATTSDLYFVAMGPDPSDGHLFAATYKEHQKNVARYRQALRQAESDAEAQAAKDALEAEQAAKAGEVPAPDGAPAP